MKLILTFILGFLTIFANAKVEKIGFVKINIPDNWSCFKEEQDHVCEPNNGSEKSEAILVIVNKDKDPIDDSFDKYSAFLKKSRKMRDLVGKNYLSKVQYTREKQILNQKWIDSLHYGSEIPGFYTRYLATYKDKIASLVTYSIAKSVYKKHASILDGMISSMQISFDQKTYEDALRSGPTSLLGARKKSDESKIVEEEAEDSKNVSEEETGKKDNSLIYFGVFFALAAGYIIWRRKQRGLG